MKVYDTRGSAGIYGPDRPGGNAGLVFDLAPTGLRARWSPQGAQ